MKLKKLTKSVSIIFMLLAMLFSCDQLTNENTDGNGNDTTQDGGNNQVGDNTTQDGGNNNSGDNNSGNENGNENSGNNQSGENNGENNEDDSNTITVDEALKIIANLTSGTHDIKIAGAINIDTFASICSAIYAINENTSVKINLDLSKTTGLTEIPASAFGGCDNLLSIVIPDSVTTISNSAFMACKNLTFNVSENNKNYSSSDDGKILYNKDKTELIAYPSAIGDITIPDSVISIGDSAFQYCRSLTNITIGNNVITIGACAFYMCDSLTNIIIPDSVTTIRSGAFSWCDKLTEVTMGNNVTSIGSSAFYYCESLINIRIPDSVTSIGDRIFEGCSSLTSVTIPDGVTSIEDNAFYGCENLTSVTLGNNVTYIGSNAFCECSNLIYNEYNNCLYLGNDNNPYLALMDSKYSDITSCEIDTNTKVIADGAFACCNNLTNINVSEDNENYYSSGTILFNKNKTKLIAYPSAMGDITIPEGVTSIGNGAFCYCDSLTSVTILEDVTSIGESTFQYCRSLTNVSIGNNVITIGDSAFYGCENLTSVTIPDSVTSIGSDAFYYCDSLTSVTIPDGVTSIGNSAFYNCNSLTTVNYKGSQEQWEQISIGSSNEDLTNATINYNYTE